MNPHIQPWHHPLWRWGYNILLLLLTPLLLLKLVSRNSDKAPLRLAERFGRVPSHIKPQSIVFHCVSMGEVNTVAPLIRILKERLPLIPIVVTTTSQTGAMRVNELFKDEVQHCYLALDLPIFIAPMLTRMSPRMFIITEVEIWPNLIKQCHQRSIPTVLLNARLSANSLNNYQALAYLFRPTLRKITHICAQSQQDYQNFIKMGVFKSQLSLTHNLKFALQITQSDERLSDHIAAAYNFTTNLIMGASTHQGEETALLEAFAQLKQQHSDLQLVLVPRYPHRFTEVIDLANAYGFKTVLVSNEVTNMQDFEVLIVDKIGWLKSFYTFANIAFVGGSLFPKGGHNALEAAIYGVPIIMGPSVYNNPEICQKLSSVGALQIIKDAPSLHLALKHCIENKEATYALGEKGRLLVSENSAALDMSLERILSLLPKSF